MESSFKNSISSAKSVLVILPENPNFDEVASATSLYLALTQDGKTEVNLYCPSPMIVEYNRLIGVNKVKSELANKNLSISFDKSYNSEGIEKIHYDIEDGQLKLIVTPKPGNTPPAQNQVILAYSGVAADAVVLIGGKDETSFEVVKSEDLKDAKLAHIGISELKLTGRNISSFATAKSSISEIVANIIKANYKLEADIATNLLAGIETGTKEFSVHGVTADTFEMVSELMRAGGKRMSQTQNQQQFPAGAIPGVAQVPSSWTENPKIFKGTSVS